MPASQARVILAICLIFNVGCMSLIPVSNPEACASNDMTLVGANYATNTGNVGSYSANSRSLDCKVPKTEEEKKEVAFYKQTGAPKIEFNDNRRWRRFYTAISFIPLIVPGIFVYNHYSNQREEAIAKSN